MVVFEFALPVDLLKAASIAYIHYLSFMLCFGALTYERISLKVNPNRQEAISKGMVGITGNRQYQRQFALGTGQ